MKKQQLLKRQISILAGDEGPRHDPYSYTEITVRFRYQGSPERRVTIHRGLGEYIEVYRGRWGRMPAASKRGPYTDGVADAEFKLLTGLSPEQAEAAHERLHRVPLHCPKCGCTRTREADGHPGESFELCAKCGTIRSCAFHPSEIE